jgi:hypothetical protein
VELADEAARNSGAREGISVVQEDEPGRHGP